MSAADADAENGQRVYINDDEIRNTDCLFGNGNRDANHIGNLAIHSLFDSVLGAYEVIQHNISLKKVFVDKLVNDVTSTGGRMLLRCFTDDEARWVIMDDAEVFKIVSHSFRSKKQNIDKGKKMATKRKERLEVVTSLTAGDKVLDFGVMVKRLLEVQGAEEANSTSEKKSADPKESQKKKATPRCGSKRKTATVILGATENNQPCSDIASTAGVTTQQRASITISTKSSSENRADIQEKIEDSAIAAMNPLTFFTNGSSYNPSWEAIAARKARSKREELQQKYRKAAVHKLIQQEVCYNRNQDELRKKEEDQSSSTATLKQGMAQAIKFAIEDAGNEVREQEQENQRRSTLAEETLKRKCLIETANRNHLQRQLFEEQRKACADKAVKMQRLSTLAQETMKTKLLLEAASRQHAQRKLNLEQRNTSSQGTLRMQQYLNIAAARRNVSQHLDFKRQQGRQQERKTKEITATGEALPLNAQQRKISKPTEAQRQHTQIAKLRQQAGEYQQVHGQKSSNQGGLNAAEVAIVQTSGQQVGATYEPDSSKDKVQQEMLEEGVLKRSQDSVITADGNVVHQQQNQKRLKLLEDGKEQHKDKAASKKDEEQLKEGGETNSRFQTDCSLGVPQKLIEIDRRTQEVQHIHQVVARRNALRQQQEELPLAIGAAPHTMGSQQSVDTAGCVQPLQTRLGLVAEQKIPLAAHTFESLSLAQRKRERAIFSKNMTQEALLQAEIDRYAEQQRQRLSISPSLDPQHREKEASSQETAPIEPIVPLTKRSSVEIPKPTIGRSTMKPIGITVSHGSADQSSKDQSHVESQDSIPNKNPLVEATSSILQSRVLREKDESAFSTFKFHQRVVEFGADLDSSKPVPAQQHLIPPQSEESQKDKDPEHFHQRLVSGTTKRLVAALELQRIINEEVERESRLLSEIKLEARPSS